MVPMRDGVRLATNVYRPAQNGKVVEGKLPVILERTPYGKDNDVYYANHWVKQGYVVILQDVRGRFGSEGVWRFFRDDINDGFETAKWISSQPWSNCAIDRRRVVSRRNTTCTSSVERAMSEGDDSRLRDF